MEKPQWLFALFVLWCASCLVTGCGIGQDPGQGDSLASRSEGGTLGSNSTANTNLRKRVDLTLVYPNADYSLGEAYLARSTLASDAIYWMLAVTNISASTRCFIKITKGDGLDAAGKVVLSDLLTYVDGSVRQLSVVETDTCLAPGESGMLASIEIESDAYDKITELRFESLTHYTTSEASEITAHVIPDGPYTVITENPFSQSVELPVKNIGSTAATVGLFSTYFLLNEKGEPLIWDYIDKKAGWDGALAVGASNLLVDVYLDYAGTASDIKAYLDYGSQNGLAGLGYIANLSFANKAEFAKYLKTMRNKIESNKQQLETNQI